MASIAVLALQGAFIEHERMLRAIARLHRRIELRQAADLARPFDGLVLPGGESTVQGKLLHELGHVRAAAPAHHRGACPSSAPAPASSFWPTISAPCPSPCAATPTAANSAASTPRVAGKKGRRGQEEAAGATCVADEKNHSSNSATLASEPVPLTFIRAPRIEALGPDVEPLVTLNDAPVAVRHHNQIAGAFHPELDDDNRLYEAFLAPLKRAY